MKRYLVAIIGIFSLGIFVVIAQDATPSSPVIFPADVCADSYAVSLLTASEACVGKPFGYVCNGGAAPQAEPQGPVANSLSALGALVDTNVVQSVHTPPLDADGSASGLAYLRVSAENSPVFFSGLLVGDVSVSNITPPDFPAWNAMLVRTQDALERCETAPYSTFIIQNPVAGLAARLVINGVSVDVSGTLAIQTTDVMTSFFVLSGEVGALAGGVTQRASAGQEMSVQHFTGDFTRPDGPASLPQPFRPERVNHLPQPLLDRPIQIAAGGIATTTGAVNLRTGPTTDSAILLQVSAQTRVTLLGRNDAGTWYHVSLSTGQTGWMHADLLMGDFTQVTRTYSATPEPIQRLGDVGQKGHVIAPRGFDLRSAPDIGFPVMHYLAAGTEFSIIARSPYSPWVSIETDAGQRGWIALLAIETRAIIDALPIDNNVPQPPEPTRIPGSWGNAFPDPTCYPNC